MVAYHRPTIISVNEYYEYYGNGRGTWIRCDDYPRTTSYNLISSGAVSGNDFYPINTNGASPTFGSFGAASYSNSTLSLSRYIHGSTNDYRTGVLQAVLGSIQSPGNFVWDFIITGDYSSYVAVYPNMTHSEPGPYLW